MNKIRMMLLCFQVERLLKSLIHRESEYIETKKILDNIRNKIFESRADSIDSY